MHVVELRVRSNETPISEMTVGTIGTIASDPPHGCKLGEVVMRVYGHRLISLENPSKTWSQVDAWASTSTVKLLPKGSVVTIIVGE